MCRTPDSNVDLEKALAEYSQSQKNSLAKYILRRKEVLDVYEKCLGKGPDGYENENIFHNILFPMRTTSDDLGLADDCNLWMLDDRLNYYEFVTSDKPLNSYSDHASNDRPDIIIFNKKTDETYSDYIAIIELKKPENYDKTVTEQVFKYINKIKEMKVLDYNGHKILLREDAWFYCYIICDTTNETLKKRIEDEDYYALYGGRGFYKLHHKLRAHVECIDHVQLVKDAKNRNRIFFDKLQSKN